MNRLEKLIKFKISLAKEECAPSAFPMSGPTRGDLRKLREAQLEAEAKADAEGFAKALDRYVSDCEGVHWWTSRKERQRMANALKETIRRNGSTKNPTDLFPKSKDVSELEVRMYSIFKHYRWHSKLNIKLRKAKRKLKNWLLKNINKI